MDKDQKFPVQYFITRANLQDSMGPQALRLTDESMEKIAKFYGERDQEDVNDIELPWEFDDDELTYVPLELKDTAGKLVPNDLVILPDWHNHIEPDEAVAIAHIPWWAVDDDETLVVSEQAAEDAGVSDNFEVWEDIDSIELIRPIADKDKRWSPDDGFYFAEPKC